MGGGQGAGGLRHETFLVQWHCNLLLRLGKLTLVEF